MNQLINKASILLLLTASTLATSCFQSLDPKSSSGSNWMRCQVLNDCSDRSEAVACRKGYCVDSKGERIVRSLEVDAGERKTVPSLSNIAFVRNGWCVSDGEVSSATIVPNQSGTEFVLTAEIYRKIDENCEYVYEDDCFTEESKQPLALTEDQVDKLEKAIAAIPEGDCHVDRTAACDACVDYDLVINGERIYGNPCDSENCDGFIVSVRRIISLIDRLVNPDGFRPDASDCYSPYSNLEYIDAPDAEGCTCDLPQQVVCIGDAVIICDSDSIHSHWKSGETCEPEYLCIEHQDVEETLQSCLQNSIFCRESSDVGFTYCRH